jgi:hypothetical protein
MSNWPAFDLTFERLRGYSAVVLVLFTLIFGVWLALTIPTLTDPSGKPLGYDFLAFWSGAHLAQQGQAAAAYGLDTIGTAHAAALGHSIPQLYLWHYPPTYFPLVWPLASMPYPLALVVFVGLTFALYWHVARQILPEPGALLPMLAFPAGLVCLMHGQNGFLTAGLFGLALLWLDRRPVLAGVAIGCLAFKPHLAVLFPLVLALDGRWRTFAAAGLTALGWVVLSWVLVGPDTFIAFIDNLPLAKALVDQGELPWAMMPSVYVAGLMAGAAPEVAMALHGGALALAVVLLVRIWRSRADWPVKGAALCAASLMVSPYVFFYDMTVLGIAIALLVAQGRLDRIRPGEPKVLALVWAAPLLMLPLAGLGLQVGALAGWAVLGLCYARVRTPRTAPAPSLRPQPAA